MWCSHEEFVEHRDPRGTEKDLVLQWEKLKEKGYATESSD